jgi:hypothetical protein
MFSEEETSQLVEAGLEFPLDFEGNKIFRNVSKSLTPKTGGGCPWRAVRDLNLEASGDVTCKLLFFSFGLYLVHKPKHRKR